jgi:hypothetical protein
MNVHDEIYSLSGETLAIQSVTAALCIGLIGKDATLRAPIAAAFDGAANFVEDLTIRTGKSASPKHTVKALRVVEELRAAVLGDK